MFTDYAKAAGKQAVYHLMSKGVHCRVFTTHEQLAVSEEKEAELAAQVQQAQQLAAAAHHALATQAQAVQAVDELAQPAQVSPPNLACLLCTLSDVIIH